MHNCFLIEPMPAKKFKKISERIAHKNKNRVDLLEVKKRLRKIRNYSLTHQNELQIKLNLSYEIDNDINLYNAEDAIQAVKLIKEISDGMLVATNKSAVINNELMPIMLAENIPVCESYFDEFKPFENRLHDYRSIPNFEFESVWETLGQPKNLSSYRYKSIKDNGCKNFVGLLGVNSISLEGGRIVFLQHMNNINKIFMESREIILVVAIDKIVNTFDDAIFLTKCMAAFGAEALPLAFRNRFLNKYNIDELEPKKGFMPAKKFNLILLDNNRSKIINSEFKDVLSCIGCRACIKVCPASKMFSSNLDNRLSPREYLFSYINSKNNSVEKCIQCKSCRYKCPLDIDIPGMIREIRTEIAKGNRTLGDYLLSKADVFENWASVVPNFSNIITDNKTARWFGEKLTGISRKRKIPNVTRLQDFSELMDIDNNGNDTNGI